MACLTRSSSARALRSASSKLIGVAAFFAPNPPSLVDFVAEDDDVVRVAPSLFGRAAEAGEEVRRADEVIRVACGAAGVVGVEGVGAGLLPKLGGGAGVEVLGLGAGDAAAGLSQLEKKSSSPPPPSPPLVSDDATERPSTQMRVGKL